MDAAEKILVTCKPLHRLVILLAATNGGEPIRGREKLQKIVFMLTDGEGWEGSPCGYDAGEYGPHSDIVDERPATWRRPGSCAPTAAGTSPPRGWAWRLQAGSQRARIAARST